MATTEENAFEIIEAIQAILAEGGDPVEAVARIATTASQDHSLLCLTVTANHDDQSVGATVTFDQRYLSPPLFDMAQNALEEFIESMSNQGKVDVSKLN